MTERAGTVKVHAQHMHTETGLWCHRCLLPSGVRMDFVLTIGGGRLTLESCALCRDCRRPAHRRRFGP